MQRRHNTLITLSETRVPALAHPKVSPEGHQPCGLGVTPATLSQWQQLSGAPFKLRRVTVYGDMRSRDVGEEHFWIVQHLGMFTGGTKGREGRGQGGLGRKRCGNKEQ